MNAIGAWDVTLSTDKGPQSLQLFVTEQGNQFTGRIESDLGNMDISGKVSGNTLSWDMKVKAPLPVTVTVTATIEGDQLSGSAKLGFFGKYQLAGRRAA